MARKGSWRIMADEFDGEESFRAYVAEELARLEHAMFRLGDGFQIAALRAEVGDGEYETVGYYFRQVFMPAVKPVADREPAPEEPESVPELAAEVADAEADLVEAPA